MCVGGEGGSYVERRGGIVVLVFRVSANQCNSLVFMKAMILGASLEYPLERINNIAFGWVIYMQYK